MQTYVLEGTMTALSSISHIGESHGINSKLRREKIIQADGSVEEVPVISGNGIRGILRDRGMLQMLALLGYGVNRETGEVMGLSLPAFYFLFSGGTLTKDAGRGIDVDQARRWRNLIPLVALFGGAMGNQIMPGKAKIGKAIPICAETAHLIPDRFHNGAALGSIWDLCQEEAYTRRDDERNETLRQLIEPQARALIEQEASAKRAKSGTDEDVAGETGQKTQMRYYCVTGDTPVMLSDGRILMAAEVHQLSQKGGLHVVSFDQARGVMVPAGLLASRSWVVPETIRVTTTHGYELKGTPDHRMLTWRDGGPCWMPLQALHEGDYIAAASQLPVQSASLDLDPIATHADGCALITNTLAHRLLRQYSPRALFRSASVVVQDGHIQTTRKRARRNRGLPEWVEKHDDLCPFPVNSRVLSATLDSGVTDRDELRRHLIAILPGTRSNIPIQPQWKLEPNHLYALGLLLADGYLKRTGQAIAFASTDPNDRSLIQGIMHSLFGITASRETDCTVDYSNVEVARFFMHTFGLRGGRKARMVRVPAIVFGLPAAHREAFVAGYLLGDGTKYQMHGRGREYGERFNISSASRLLTIDLAYLLTSLGYLASLSSDPEPRYILGNGPVQLHHVEWCQAISDRKRYVPPGEGAWLTEWRRERVMTKAEVSAAAGVNHTTLLAFERGDYAPSRQTLARIEQATGVTSAISKLPLEWVRIQRLEKQVIAEDIYAFEVDRMHNFVCGTGPLLSHNCETLAAGTRLFWEVTLDDVTPLEFEAFCVTLAEFGRFPYLGGKSGVGHGKVAIKFDKWVSIDPRLAPQGKEMAFSLGAAYVEHLRSRGDDIRGLIDGLA